MDFIIKALISTLVHKSTSWWVFFSPTDHLLGLHVFYQYHQTAAADVFCFGCLCVMCTGSVDGTLRSTMPALTKLVITLQKTKVLTSVELTTGTVEISIV